MSKKIIGIDLGTTNSCVTVIEGGNVEVVNNSEGNRTTPSMVSFPKKGTGGRQVGALAKRQAITNPERTVLSFKRLMGKKFSQIQSITDKFPYKIVEGPKGTVLIEIGDRKYTPQEISAMVLQKLKKDAEDFLGKPVQDAVITVPAYFNDAERQATREAAQIAGLEAKRIINEPTAAALAYGIDKENSDKLIAVFDLGGGTFDVSILDMGGGVFEVKSTNGDLNLGGDNFDECIIDWLLGEFKAAEGVDLRKDPTALQRLKEAAEKAKIELSSKNSTELNLPYLTAVDGVPKHLATTLSRSKFEALIEPHLRKLEVISKQAISDAKLSSSETIDEVILVGGSTRIPSVQEKVASIFGKKPSKGVNPDEAVAIGAAIQGGVMTGEKNDVVLLDVTPLNLGIETLGGVCTVVIPANTTIPTKKTQTFSTAQDNQPEVQIHVLQGKRTLAKDNKTLANFNLTGLPPAPRGVPQIEVTFDIDANGILSVSAKDKATGKEQQMRIEGSSNLSDAEIEKMKKDAEAHAKADEEAKARIDKINEADALIFRTEKQLEEMKDTLSDERKKTITDQVEVLRKAHKAADLDEIEKAMKPLQASWESLVKHMMEEAQKKQQKSGETPAGGTDPSADASSASSSSDAAEEVPFEEVSTENK